MMGRARAGRAADEVSKVEGYKLVQSHESLSAFKTTRLLQMLRMYLISAKSLVLLMFLGPVPISTGVAATLASQSYLAATVHESTGGSSCIILTESKWYGWPLPYVVKANYTVVNGQACLIKTRCMLEPCVLDGPFVLDVLFFMAVYYLPIVGYYVTRRLVHMRQARL